jgi:hypothetical protein
MRRNDENARGTYPPIPGLRNDINRQMDGMLEIAYNAKRKSKRWNHLTALFRNWR